MRLPPPQSVSKMVSYRSTAYCNTFKRKASGKQGVTQKGLLKMIKVAVKKGKDVSELQRQAVAISVHKCGVCNACFQYESQLSHH